MSDTTEPTLEEQGQDTHDLWESIRQYMDRYGDANETAKDEDEFHSFVAVLHELEPDSKIVNALQNWQAAVYQIYEAFWHVSGWNDHIMDGV